MPNPITWDEAENRRYEYGVSKGVLFPMNDDGGYAAGVPWNGLTNVTDSPEGADVNKLWADGIQYAGITGAETYKTSIEAYTYPDEFAACDGSAQPVEGMYMGQQKRKKFGMSWRTEIGNANTETLGYKLHIAYGLLASPTEKSHDTVNDSPDAATFSWDAEGTPVPVPGYPNMSHRVVKDCFHKVIDGWTYRQAVCILDGQYDREIGYNPGSQMIQIAGIGILNALDHYVKEVLCVQFYIRYMDDFILIHHDRRFLVECQAKIAQMLLGLECRFNTKKTGISPLTDGILFLGFQYRMTRTGKVIMTLNSDNVRHERKKLRKLVHLAKKGERTREKVDECYASWKNHAAKGNSYKLLRRMDEYYKKLWQEDFPEEPPAKRKGDERK